MHILVVGGAYQNDLVRILIGSPEFLVEHATNPRQIRADFHRLHAVIIDAPLPDYEVPSFCSYLRQLGVQVPLIVISTTNDEREVVEAFDAGAIDYLTRPVRQDELIARLRNHIRFFQRSETIRLPIGPYWLNRSTRLLYNADLTPRVRLTATEVKILICLYEAKGTIISQEALFDMVWGENAYQTLHNVPTHIYRLRRKIERDPNVPSIIIKDERGYRLGLIDGQ